MGPLLDAIRERYANDVYEAVKADATLATLDVVFERSLVRAVDLRDTASAIAVTLGEDVVVDDLISQTTWQTELLVHVVTQDEEPDRAADRFHVLTHPIVMRYTAPGLRGVRPVRISAPLYSNAGGATCVRTATYLLLYETAPDSIAQ